MASVVLTYMYVWGLYVGIVSHSFCPGYSSIFNDFERYKGCSSLSLYSHKTEKQVPLSSDNLISDWYRLGESQYIDEGVRICVSTHLDVSLNLTQLNFVAYSLH